MKTSDGNANDGFCPECHNELKRDLAGRGFRMHKDSNYRLDRRGGVPLKDGSGNYIRCTYGYSERDDTPKRVNWRRDELILALDLYFQVNPLHTSEANPEIVALSKFLKTLPIHSDHLDTERFRNPDGVYMKLCNFLRLDPTYAGAGLKSGSRKDEEVWNEFAEDKDRLHAAAQAIRSALKDGGDEAEAVRGNTTDDSEEAPEGTLLTRLHKVRERNRELVERKKRKTLESTGRLECRVCGFNFADTYGELGDGFIECHHTLPISQLLPGQKTRLSDLALVCANCHRMLHRGKRWLPVDELRTIRDSLFEATEVRAF